MHMSTDIRKLRHLVALADWGNFSRAADAVGLSQPALSRSIAGLEAACGQRLFDRTASGIVPTVFAGPLIRQARALVASLAEFESDLKQRISGQSGRLAFGCGPLVASLSFGTVLPAILERGLNLAISTLVGNAVDLLEAIASARIEFAVFTTDDPPQGREFAIDPVGHVRIGYLVRQGHPLAGRQGLLLDDLAAYPLASGAAPGERLQSPFGNRANTIACDNFHILRDLAASSNVVWLGSPAMVRGTAAPLVEITIGDGVAGDYPLSCYRLRNREPSPPAHHALECFRQAFGR